MANTSSGQVYTNNLLKKTPINNNQVSVVTKAPASNMPKQQVQSSAISAGAMKEIQRKAESGIQMSAPTADKQKLYDQFQQQLTKTIQQKAQNGTALSNPNAWKNSIYEQYSTPKTPDFDFEKAFGDFSTGFDGKFTEMQSMYEQRMTALEKMLQDMIGTNKYNAGQQQAPVNSSQGVYDGSHIFTAPNQGATVGSTQSNNGVNDTLFKYLQNVWNGGF